MRRVDAAPLLAAVGGVILLVSLFLDWYQPGLSAWTVFEVLDLVLAGLALGALGAGVSGLLSERPSGDGLLPVLGGAAFVIVVSQIINHPPAAQGASVQGGAWLGLAGSALMATGGILGAAGISVGLSWSSAPDEGVPDRRERGREPPPAPPRRREPSPATEAAAIEPEVQDELYPDEERRGPIGADDPEPWTAGPEDETLTFDPDRDERS